MTALQKINGLYEIIPLTVLRRTPNVAFDAFPMDLFPRVDAIDRVLHGKSAISPGSIDEVKRPWYMHPHQDDNLLVLQGVRYVDIYTPEHGKVESFEVRPDVITKDGEVFFEGGAILVWPRKVFHRIQSGEEGSASVNIAVHYDGLDMKTNFNIYDVNTETGNYHVIREGFRDQPSS